jgi:hypothetical protein
MQMNTKQSRTTFALCINNRDCEDLEKGKVYQVIKDERAAKEGYLRVVDESTEDYLYPSSYFVAIELPKKAEDALMERV